MRLRPWILFLSVFLSIVPIAALLSPPHLFPFVAAMLTLAFLALAALWLRRRWLLAVVGRRELRTRERDATTESPLERAIAAELDRRRIAYSREHRVSRTRIDFAFPGSMLAVECDGWRYHGSPAQRDRDRRRDEFLRRQGWRVLRLSGEDIRRDPAACVQRIADAL